MLKSIKILSGNPFGITMEKKIKYMNHTDLLIRLWFKLLYSIDVLYGIFLYFLLIYKLGGLVSHKKKNGLTEIKFICNDEKDN